MLLLSRAVVVVVDAQDSAGDGTIGVQPALAWRISNGGEVVPTPGWEPVWAVPELNLQVANQNGGPPQSLGTTRVSRVHVR